MAEQLSTYTRCTGAGCGSLLLWCLTVGGQRMPLDPDPHPDGNVLITRLPDGSVRGRVLTGAELPAEGRITYRPHHRTCPAAAEFKRRKAAMAPKCADCGHELALVLVDLGRRYHDLCGPDPVIARRPRLGCADVDARVDRGAAEQLTLDARDAS